MPYNPTSKVLFVSICSLTKAGGGQAEYDADEAITAELPPPLAGNLLHRRERVRQLVREARGVRWQRVPLPDLPYNRHLTEGPDFGGNCPATYRPALERYDGRFFLAMGSERAAALRASPHHLLLLSGLYGLLRPFEPIQLYSCPLTARVAGLWHEDGVLTEVLCDYVVKREITRIIDLTAIDAHRRLVDWDEVSGYGVQVLHCFDAMGAGAAALIPFGRALRGRLLGMTEGELLALEPEDRMDGLAFRALAVPGRGFPHRAAAVTAARAEEDIVQAHVIESVGEVLGGGNPEPPARRGENRWQFAMLARFQRDIRRHPDLFAQVVNAIVKVCQDPKVLHGDTIAPLTGDMAGSWRYRLGDFRLVYRPNDDRRTVYFHRFGPRRDVYD